MGPTATMLHPRILKHWEKSRKAEPVPAVGRGCVNDPKHLDFSIVGLLPPCGLSVWVACSNTGWQPGHTGRGASRFCNILLLLLKFGKR